MSVMSNPRNEFKGLLSNELVNIITITPNNIVFTFKNGKKYMITKTREKLINLILEITSLTAPDELIERDANILNILRTIKTHNIV